MAELPFNFLGYEFQSGLDVLRKSAQTGLAALSGKINALERQLQDYRRIGEFEGERDEEGHVLWERDDALDHEIAFADDARMELRKAFAIAIFHHWERSVQRWIAQENRTAASDGSDTPTKPPARGLKKLRCFEKLSEAARDVGYPPHPELEHVVTLANTLKHNNEKHGKKLLEKWPDIFPLQFQKPPRLSDWASAIQLTDQHLSEIFDIVSKSGPTVHSTNPTAINNIRVVS